MGINILGNLILKQFILGSLENNNYLLIDTDTKEAVLFDCTAPSKEIDDVLAQYGANLKYILLTHGHFDHILGVNYFREKYNCKVLMNKDDKVFVDNVKELGRVFTNEDLQVQTIDDYVNDGDIIDFAGKGIKVINTPGHTKGGVCYLIDDMLFTGDTIFRESVGRTDLLGGDFSELESSIRGKIFPLDENIKIFPGHGPNSTVGWEKENNNFL